MAKQVNVNDVMAEFMFAESVHRFNELRQEHRQPLLTTTNARNLHDRFMAGFHARLDPSIPANQTENSWATKQQQGRRARARAGRRFRCRAAPSLLLLLRRGRGGLGGPLTVGAHE